MCSVYVWQLTHGWNSWCSIFMSSGFIRIKVLINVSFVMCTTSLTSIKLCNSIANQTFICIIFYHISKTLRMYLKETIAMKFLKIHFREFANNLNLTVSFDNSFNCNFTSYPFCNGIFQCCMNNLKITHWYPEFMQSIVVEGLKTTVALMEITSGIPKGYSFVSCLC